MEAHTLISQGWKDDLSIDWVHEPYPEDIGELLVNEDLDELEGCGDPIDASKDDEEE